MIKFRPRNRPGGTRHRPLRAVAAGLAAAGMLAAGGSLAAAASTTATASVRPAGGTADCDSLTTCYTPRQLQVAYGLRPLLARGIDGRGQTVVLPELAEPRLSPPAVSDLRQDLAQFDRLFGLPAARLRVVTRLAGSAAPWLANGEEVLDAEMAHAIAPGAAITVVLVKATSLNNTANALAAADPLVLAAGGSGLTASHQTGAYIRETAWGLPYGTPGSAFQASGGGFSRLFARPRYQDGVAGIGATRAVPDVAADASGHTGMALAISEGGSKVYIRNSGGTSASAPFWAALIALADQYAHRHLGFVNPALYRITRSGSYHGAFHDITSGNNTVKFPPKTFAGYRAAPGWDPVTGWGSPDARVLVPLLAAL